MLKKIQIANAVDSLIEVHGSPAFSVIFDKQKPQTRKDILDISRKSRERQYERIIDVFAWEEGSIGPESGDSAPDTMNFAKVLTRIGRAKGPLRIACEILKSQLPQLDADVRVKINESLGVYRKQLPQLSKHVRKMATMEAKEPYQPRPQQPKNKLTLKKLPGQLNSGVSMLTKTNRDIIADSPLYDLRPTPAQKARALEQLKVTKGFLKELSEAMASI